MFNPTDYGLTDDSAIGFIQQNPTGSAQWLSEHGVSQNDITDWGNNIGRSATVSSLYGRSPSVPQTEIPQTGGPTSFNPSEFGWTNQDVFEAFQRDPQGAAQYLNNIGVTAEDLSGWLSSIGQPASARAISAKFGVNLASDRMPAYDPNNFQQSRTGLPKDYLNQFLGSLMPQFKNSMDNLDSNITGYFNKAKQANADQTQDLLHSVLQTSLNSLASRGMTNSKVASTAIGNATGDVMKNVLNQNLQLGVAEAKARTQLPSSLGQLMQYGQVSTASDPGGPFRDLLSLF